jgi:hypothetical protein
MAGAKSRLPCPLQRVAEFSNLVKLPRERFAMQRSIVLAFIAAIAAALITSTPASAASPTEKGKTCRMEQQCRWENFKKICVYVKVCR